MIIFSTEAGNGHTIVRLRGAIDRHDAPDRLAHHLSQLVDAGPILVDTSELAEMESPHVGEFLAALGALVGHQDVVLTDQAMARRRGLRSIGHGLPVVPDLASAIRGRVLQDVDGLR